MGIVNAINSTVKRVPVWAMYVLLTIPLALYTYWMLTGGLGADPIRVFEHEIGLIALQLLIVGLAITPLREKFRINLLKYRRAVGLMAFYYTFAHLAVYVVLDQSLDMGEVWKDIVKRPYITFGMAAFALMVPLAVTSNNLSVRRMGAQAWQKLHKLVYLIAIGGVLHFMLLTKTWEIEPMVYGVVLLGLLGLRFQKSWSARRKTMQA